MHELAGAYAVDALPDDERRFFERHLADCAGCRAEIDELQATAALLGMAADDEPPPGMRARVLAAVAATEQERPPDATQREQPPAVTPGSGDGWRGSLRRLLPAVAAVIALGVAGLVVVVTQASPPGGEDQLAELVAAPDAQIVDLTAPAGTTARFVWSAERGEGLLVTEGLQAAPDGHAYALWVIDAEAPALVGVLQPDERGRATHAVGERLGPATAIAVTLEHAEPPDQPTTDPFIHGSL